MVPFTLGRMLQDCAYQKQFPLCIIMQGIIVFQLMLLCFFPVGKSLKSIWVSINRFAATFLWSIWFRSSTNIQCTCLHQSSVLLPFLAELSQEYFTWIASNHVEFIGCLIRIIYDSKLFHLTLKSLKSISGNLLWKNRPQTCICDCIARNIAQEWEKKEIIHMNKRV